MALASFTLSFKIYILKILLIYCSKEVSEHVFWNIQITWYWNGKGDVQMFTHFTRAPVFWEERCWVIPICTSVPCDFYSMVWVEILHPVRFLGKQEKKRIFTGGTSGKEPACQRRKHKRCGFNPWIRKIPGGGHGNPLQDSCLENPHGQRSLVGYSVAKSWTRLKWLSMHAQEIKIRLLFYMKGKIFQLIPSLLSANLILICVLVCT